MFVFVSTFEYCCNCSCRIIPGLYIISFLSALVIGFLIPLYYPVNG